ncbi:putative translation initiation factor eif-2b beta subunit [Fasciolopsis buskii]|uniref:Translation initiation factor eIF2B subunit beta n=1 Tax=Fasciolopsis buskii TaxID=27845 RepID=A0A8E0S1A1_9TREM|nr:putative translation initiation factor eif-2b beta subunit [Fasciolopsis buski]
MNCQIISLSREQSYKVVLSVFESLRSRVIEGNWSNLRDLIKLLLEETKSFLRSTDEVTPVLHIALRILKTAREEALKVTLGAHADFEENTTNRLFASGDTSYENVSKAEILDSVMSAIDELIIDIKSCSENISDLSLNFIHSDETILTCGFSRQVYQFLRGHKLANELTKDGISVILVPDTHSFAMMSRVNKVILLFFLFFQVIIGCDAVYLDGTLKAPVGTYSTLLAAKHFSTPVSFGILELNCFTFES